MRKAATGNPVLEIAERIYPWLLKMFDGIRGDDGMLLQPAHVRAISLNVAQRLVHKQQQKHGA